MAPGAMCVRSVRTAGLPPMLRCALRATLFVAVAAAATAATAAADADCEEVSMLVAKQVPGQEKNDPLRTETQNEVMLLSSNLQYQVVFTDTDANELSSFLEGCRQIFLDVGSNRGTHVRKLFEPQKYAGAPYLKVFERVFGPAWKRRTPSSGICAVGFEPNSEWIPHHQDIERTYAKQGWKVKFFPVAVSDHEGKLEFFHGTKGNSEVGFSAFRHNHSGQTVEVQMEPFSQFISRINTTVPSGIRLVKMDIEGLRAILLHPHAKVGVELDGKQGLESVNGQAMEVCVERSTMLNARSVTMENVPSIQTHPDFQQVKKLINECNYIIGHEGIDEVYPVLPIKRKRWMTTLLPKGILVDRIPQAGQISVMFASVWREELTGLGKSLQRPHLADALDAKDHALLPRNMLQGKTILLGGRTQ
ncbi:unnamed protein product [Durusdinium trenchii]|uniref:Methyltransferase FkbM domain-containing protein n=1 Tax=Durusdinium trenchii TaxID=1381693 RepID=A0ABP0QFY7_9DINO